MLCLLLCLVLQEAEAHQLNNGWFERDSAINLKCKEAEQWTTISEVSCVIATAAEKVYNFGTVLHENTCMVCRADGMPADVNVLETPSIGPISVDGKESKVGFYYYLICV